MCYLSLAIVFLLGSAGINADNSSDLARVGIVRFINNSDSPDFEWVEKSLPDAIDHSMKARFEYIRLDDAKVDGAASQVAAGPTGYTGESAAQIALLAQADILIYGNFVVDAASQELVLKSVIYNAEGKRVIGRVESRTPMNAKIFKNIDQMAAEIVAEIYRFALQANQGSSQKHLKLLVLVPSFANATEEQMARQELEHLKQELQVRNPGKYLTIFEFFDEYHVTEIEQQAALKYAKQRERGRLQLWLEHYGVTDAMIVLVSENKVNITAIGAKKTAQVSYAVNATPEEKAKQVAAAQAEVAGKVELKKDAGLGGARFTMLIGPTFVKGALASGGQFGVISGLNIHSSYRLWRFLEPHVQLDMYYGFPSGNVKQFVGGSALGGLGYTFGNERFAVSPYLGAGIFTGQVNAAGGVFSVLLPSAGGGLIFKYFLSQRLGIALSAHSQYIFDAANPALFTSITLSSVLRF